MAAARVMDVSSDCDRLATALLGYAEAIEREGGSHAGICRRSSKPGEAQRLATGFTFTEGPLYHPDGFYYFVDVRESKFYRLRPGGPAELLRENTGEGNGTTFDPQGRLVICEGGNRRLTRWPADGQLRLVRGAGRPVRGQAPLPAQRCGLHLRRQHLFHQSRACGYRWPSASSTRPAVYRVKPDGSVSHVADVEYPNGLAFSPDERTLYVANTRFAMYIHAIELDSAGNIVRRRIFADMSSDEKIGVPDGMKVDVEGRVYCTGPGGTWVFAPERRAARHHQDAGGAGQSVFRRPRHEDAVLHRPHLGLQPARQGAGPARASVRK